MMLKVLQLVNIPFSVDDAVRETGLGEQGAKDHLRRLGKRVTRVARWQSFFVIKGDGDASFGGPRYNRWLDDCLASTSLPCLALLRTINPLFTCYSFCANSYPNF